MDEKKNIEITEDLAAQMAEGLNGSTLSRRERRRLAEAQNAAKTPAAEASHTPSLFDEPAVENSLEATRVFKAVDVRNVEAAPVQPAEPLRTPAAPAAEATREFFAFNEEEEPVKENAPEDVPEEEEVPEEPAPKKKGGLFGKKKSEPEPEEDDEDEDDDEEEEDDYDRMDDDDDDDEDSEHRSFGYHLIGFFKGLFELILVLLVLILALNVLDFFNVLPLDKLYNRYSPKAPQVFSTLFPSQELKQMTAPATPDETLTTTQEPFAPVEPAEADATQEPVTPVETEQPVELMPAA